MLLAVHFPKAGGSSLGLALNEAYGDRFVRDYSDDPAVPEFPRALDPVGYFQRSVRLPENAGCIFGHFHPNKYRMVKNAARFVMLRHPVDNIFSIYSFFRSQAVFGSLMRYVVENNLSILQLAELPLIRRLMSWTYFEGVDMSTFDLIGRHEQRLSSIKALSTLIGKELNPNIWDNKTPTTKEWEEIGSDHCLRNSLSKLLADDIRFYERYAFRDIA